MSTYDTWSKESLIKELVRRDEHLKKTMSLFDKWRAEDKEREKKKTTRADTYEGSCQSCGSRNCIC